MRLLCAAETALQRLFCPGSNIENSNSCFTHHSARVPLDGLLDLAVGAPSQRLQELVAVLQVVLVVVLLHSGVPPAIAACRGLFGRVARKHGWSWLGRGGVTPRRRLRRRGAALLGPRRSWPPVGR